MNEDIEKINGSIERLKLFKQKLADLGEQTEKLKEQKASLFSMLEYKIGKAQEEFQEHYDEEGHEWRLGLKLFQRYVEIDFRGGDSLKIQLKYEDEQYRGDYRVDPPYFLYHEWGVSVCGGRTQAKTGQGVSVIEEPVTTFQEHIYRFIIDNFLLVCEIGFAGATHDTKETVRKITDEFAYNQEQYNEVAFLEGVSVGNEE